MENELPKLLQGMEIRPEFVLLDVDAETDAEALGKLAQKLLDNGVVKPGFLPAILKREEEYCTGITFADMGIAIPHTDPEHVNSPCIGIATMRKPVVFQSMGMPDTPCQVEMLFMLGITEPHTQLDFLKTLMLTFQTEGRLTDLKSSQSAEKLVGLFKSYFV